MLSVTRSERQRRSQQRLDARLERVRTAARRAASARRRAEQRQAALERIRNGNPPEIVAPDVAQRVMYSVLLAALPTAYAVDVILLGPVAEFLASYGFPADAVIVRAAPFLVPAAVISLETIIATFRIAAYHEHLDGAPRTAYVLLTCAATGFAVCVPAAGVALYLAQEVAFPDTALERLVVLLPTALTVVLSLACHLTILLGGRGLHEAKAWMACAVRCRRLGREIEHARQAFERASTQAADHFVQYLRDLEAHNRAHQPAQAAGPFDHETRAIINDVFGYEVIQAAPGTPPPRPTPPPAPPIPRDAAALPAPGVGASPTADAPDGPGMAARRQYEDEAEVRP